MRTEQEQQAGVPTIWTLWRIWAGIGLQSFGGASVQDSKARELLQSLSAHAGRVNSALTRLGEVRSAPMTRQSP